MANQPDVVIAGAGVIGCAAARALALDGFRVTLVDPKPPCREASHAAGGLLTPQSESTGPGPFFDLCRRARSLYPDFVAGLLDETGIDSELRQRGMLLVAIDDDDETVLEESLRWQTTQDLRVERLSTEALREREPLINPAARWGLYLPDDVQVENRRLCAALVASLNRLGVDWLIGDRVESVEVRGSRLNGVSLASGTRLGCASFLLAAGAWSGQVQELPRRVPVRPLRGQMLQMSSLTPVPEHNLGSPRGYLVPRVDGRILAGSTMEDVGFRREISVVGIREILDTVLELAPDLATARIESAWSGFRPGTPDELPIIGPDPEIGGLIYATGHFRNGILLAPITADLVAELMRGDEPLTDLEAFRVGRFDGQ